MTKIQKRDDVFSDECLGLLSVFIKVSDRKARSEIIRFAERCVHFDSKSLIIFGEDEAAGQQPRRQEQSTSAASNGAPTIPKLDERGGNTVRS